MKFSEFISSLQSRYWKNITIENSGYLTVIDETPEPNLELHKAKKIK